MQRRDVIKMLAGTAALPFLSGEALALFQAVHQELPATAALKTLNPHQDATITAIAEWIIPKTETPGAKDVRVNEFIDLILSEWMDDEEREKFLAGLASVDARSHEAFGKDFVDGSPADQKQMLTALDEEATEFRQNVVEVPQHGKKHSVPVEQPFFQSMKQLTLVGYFTSEAGAKEALHFQIIPSQHVACAPLEEEAAK